MTQHYKDILESVLAVVKTVNTGSIIGFLPPAGGIAISFAGGEASTDMAGNSYLSLRVNVSAKAGTQVECVDMLDKAHGALQRMDTDKNGCHIYCGTITGAPQLAAQDASGMWIVTSIVRVKATSDRGV